MKARRLASIVAALPVLAAIGYLAAGSLADSDFVSPEPVPPGATPRVIDRVRELFPQTAGWFRIVGTARFDPGPDGRLVPDLESLTHPRVRWEDGAGHSILAQHAPTYRNATRIGSVHDDSIWIDVVPEEGRDVAAEIQDGLVVYPGALEDTDVLYKSTPTHVDEYLLLESPRAPTRWTYRVHRGPGIVSVRQGGNQIEAIDARGVPWMRAGAPRAIDREGTRATGTIRVEGERIIVDIDLSELTFPVLVDPDWRSTGDMAYGRFYHRAHVLPDGRLLVTGGCTASVCSGDLTIPSCPAIVSALEALDPGSRTFSRIADSTVRRYFHAGESLRDGSVLTVGGCVTPDCSGTTDQAELFDPVSNTVRQVAPLPESGAGMFSALLPDGRVLVAGGCSRTSCTRGAWAFDPASESWTALASLNEGRGRASATVLEGGRVLVAGGCRDILCAGVHASAEIYDPALGAWTTITMSAPRAGHWAAPTPGGGAIVGGGCSTQACASVLQSTELFDPRTDGFWPGPALRRARLGAEALALPDGAVLVNQGCATRETCELSNELLGAGGVAFADVEGAVTVRGFHQTVLHPSGLVIANGGCQPSTCSWWNETWDVSALEPLPDGGVRPIPDAGAPRDAGVRADAGVRVDAGTTEDPGGCGCRAGAVPSTPSLAWLLGALALLMWRRRS